ncbi:MAG: glycosyltransferase [Prevotella sp.]|nr:glycosyltransferase [Prevotella sp.]
MKVSIITVAYNSAETIEKAISSVLSQTYSDIEYIIVDGLSTDKTMETVQSYEGKFDGRLRWNSEKDKGIYDAMNKGIRMATGDIIGILNSDDFFTSSNVIERIVKEFSDDVDAVYGDVHFVKPSNPSKSVRYYSGRPFRPWMVRFGFIPPHPSLYVRRRVYEEHGLYDTSFRISADVEMIARLSYVKKIPMKYINMDFVTMLVGGESTKSMENRRLGTKEDLIACQKLGIKSNIVFVHFKYFLKAFGYLQ